MKLLLIAFALIGCAIAAQLPDSATQGPNPQDIATPEPEYIDIDLPDPAAPPPAPSAIQSRSSFGSASIAAARPVQRPAVHFAPQQHSFASVAQQLPGHSYSHQSGYQYRRPVYVRRAYRRRFY